MKNIDRLFLALNCADCGMIKAELDFNTVMDDDFRGKLGQQFHVLSALSNDASRELLDKYDLNDCFTPVLLKDNGQIIDDQSDIILYLREQGMIGNAD